MNQNTFKDRLLPLLPLADSEQVLQFITFDRDGAPRLRRKNGKTRLIGEMMLAAHYDICPWCGTECDTDNGFGDGDCPTCGAHYDWEEEIEFDLPPGCRDEVLEVIKRHVERLNS